MKLTSSAFDHGKKIPSKYTCDGENINPPLTLSDVPSGAKSLALIMEDPDVPKNIRKDGMWDHWVVFDMPPDLRKIDEGKEPPGKAGAGTSGEKGYFGPCPPDREHRYFFKLFALDAKLDLPERCSKKGVEKAMERHILEKTELMGKYTRS
jgi:Raf kinase inhibitor-like YbhB/YbcL family protein